MSGGKDPCWKYATPELNDKNTVICNFCGKQTKGGIFRAKKHLVGGFRDVRKCLLCPESVRKEIAMYMRRKGKSKAKMGVTDTRLSNFVPDLGGGDFEPDEYDDCEDTDSGDEIEVKRVKIEPGTESCKGPMDAFVSVKRPRSESGEDDIRGEAVENFAKWFYTGGIRLSLVEEPCFVKMWCTMCREWGGDLKPPTVDELEGPVLENEKRKIDVIVKSRKAEWGKYGCSLILDGWRDEAEGKDFLNVLVHSSQGMVFLMSKEVSNIVNDPQKLSLLLESLVKYVGEEKVVQVVTDDVPTYAAAGKSLEMQGRHLFWSPCATRCIDLMLEDIGKFPRIREAIKKAVFLNYYLFNQIGISLILRKYTGKTELLWHAVTRFATTFITFKVIYELKHNLRKMVVSDDWRKKKWSRDAEAKKCVRIVLMESFWRDIAYAIKLTIPLVKVLALVYSDKPSMGHIFGAIDQAKEAIAKSFNHNEERYKEAFEIIDNRWKCQLHQPLHAAGYFLNPRIFCDNRQAVSDNNDIINALHQCIERLVPSQDEKYAVKAELLKYQNAEGIFGVDSVISAMKTRSPVKWWDEFGGPHLKKLAIKILGLNCSATRHEKKWDIFKQIHSFRLIRMPPSTERKLLFVRYNLLIMDQKCQNEIDPLLSNDFSDDNEWLIGIMEDDDEDLNQSTVQEADWSRKIQVPDNEEEKEIDWDEEIVVEGLNELNLDLHACSDTDNEDMEDGFI